MFSHLANRSSRFRSEVELAFLHGKSGQYELRADDASHSNGRGKIFRAIAQLNVVAEVWHLVADQSRILGHIPPGIDVYKTLTAPDNNPVLLYREKSNT